MEHVWKWNCREISKRVNEELGERIRASEGDHVRWKGGGSCEFERLNGPTGRPTLHGNCERHRHGVVGCARIVKETPNGAENTDFSASSFLSFFFFPSLSFPAIFRRILFQPDSPSYVAWPIEHAKITFRSPLSFSPREEKLKRWEKWMEKGRRVARELVAFTTWI